MRRRLSWVSSQRVSNTEKVLMSLLTEGQFCFHFSPSLSGLPDPALVVGSWACSTQPGWWRAGVGARGPTSRSSPNARASTNCYLRQPPTPSAPTSPNTPLTLAQGQYSNVIGFVNLTEKNFLHRRSVMRKEYSWVSFQRVSNNTISAQ